MTSTRDREVIPWSVALGFVGLWMQVCFDELRFVVLSERATPMSAPVLTTGGLTT